MRHVLGALLAVGMGFGAGAQEFPVVTLEGVLIDLHCYARAVAEGSDDAIATDAEACQTLEDSNPVGVLVKSPSGSRAYVLASPPMLLVEHLGAVARVTGQLREQAALIKPDKLEVERDGGWLEVRLLPEM